MRIRLVAPRMSCRPMDTAWKTRMSPPLALLVLGVLTPPEHEVALADENIESIRHDDSWPDLVGITVKADTFYRSAEMAAAYRARGILVVMGGIHPTACPDDCARFADALVIGEAEVLWPRLIADAAAGRLQKIYRNESPVDPSLIPIPRWNLLHEKSYLFTNTLFVGRGCPWRCEFCYNRSPNLDARYRTKPVDHVVAEIESLGISHVMFIDDNFIGDPARAADLADRLGRMDITWHAAVSADLLRHGDLLDRKFGAATSWAGRVLGMRTMAKLAKRFAYPPGRRRGARLPCPTAGVMREA